MAASSNRIEPEQQFLSWIVPRRSNGRALSVVFFVGLAFYVGTVVLVAPLDWVLKLIVPHLPWISRPYVDPDPPAIQVAFKCANLVGTYWLACALLVLLANQIDQRIIVSKDHISCQMLKLSRKFSYASLSNVRIESCIGGAWRLRFAQVHAGQNVRWVVYGIPANVPVDALIEFFRSRGLEVTTSTSERPR